MPSATSDTPLPEMQHTPGPWEWRDLGGGLMLMTVNHGKLIVLQPARKGMQLATFRMRDNYCVMREMTPNHPDARLIKSSPVLLDALRVLVSACERQDEDGVTEEEYLAALAQANDAIAQAILPSVEGDLDA